MPTEEKIREETGGFSVWQGGIKVAGGSGPYNQIKREAAHYVLVYGQDGPLKYRIWKHRRAGQASVGGRGKT